MFRTVQVQPWLHLEGTQGPCSEAEVRVYTSSHFPPPALVTTPVALRAGFRQVCNAGSGLLCLLPGAPTRKRHIAHGARASLPAQEMMSCLLGRREGLRQKPVCPDGPFQMCSGLGLGHFPGASLAGLVQVPLQRGGPCSRGVCSA